MHAVPKSPFGPALRAALEASLILTPVGVLAFYPFIQEYQLLDPAANVFYAAACALGATLGISLLVLVPASLAILHLRRQVSRKELAGSLGTLALLMVLGATLLYKGFAGPGSTGQLLLFALLFTIMGITWLFSLRLHAKMPLT